MKKLVRGILEFRKNIRPEYKERFAQLANGQQPDALFIACSDSRVVPNLFASTNPGDLFTDRNVGNIYPPCGSDGRSIQDESEAAAIEFSVGVLKVKDIIVCGHSKCGAMQTLLGGEYNPEFPHLRGWLRHAEGALARLEKTYDPDSSWSKVDQLSQTNVLHQIENIKTYPLIRKAIETRGLRLHGWWFDIPNAEVYIFNEEEKRFKVIDEVEGQRLLSIIEKDS